MKLLFTLAKLASTMTNDKPNKPENEKIVEVNRLSSPPCYLHEIDPNYSNLKTKGDFAQAIDVARWRKAERIRLTEARKNQRRDERKSNNDGIIFHMLQALGEVKGLVIVGYWPIPGEPNIRPLFEYIEAHGGKLALPVVIEKKQPLIFRSWTKGDPLVRGVWNIPVPSEQEKQVRPDIVITPLVGFDGHCHRLGNGGGYYDRTFEKMIPKPKIIGVGYSFCELPTIYPQWHDIAMDIIITEKGCYYSADATNN